MPTCRDVSRTVSSGEIDTASLFERLGCWFHFLMCPRCREYRDQIDGIGEIVRDEAAEPDSDRLAEIEAEILSKLLGEGPPAEGACT